MRHCVNLRLYVFEIYFKEMIILLKQKQIKLLKNKLFLLLLDFGQNFHCW